MDYPVVEVSASTFSTPQALLTQVKKDITQSTRPGEFVYNDVSLAWSRPILDALEEDGEVEASNARF
ncbi:hypothetical protein MW887_009124 [Aspergillus wentii]|nr:hypothetical protein MW887_009124 [Aspergillus wentii]